MTQSVTRSPIELFWTAKKPSYTKENENKAKRFSQLRCKETKVTDQCDTIVIISRLLMNSILEAKATTSRASTFQKISKLLEHLEVGGKSRRQKG